MRNGPVKFGGRLVTDAIGTGKAEILNDQYEPADPTPDLSPSPYSKLLKMPEIEASGVSKLWKHLNPDKAAGPDAMSAQVLKELHVKISPTFGSDF